jgi:hypothetical protein
MKRYGRGWFGDSYRHYLAGKGVTTARFTKQKQYFAEDEAEGFMAKHKLTMESNLQPSDRGVRESFIEKEKKMVTDGLMRKVDSGKLDSLHMGSELQPFEAETRAYMQDGDAEQYKANLRRIYPDLYPDSEKPDSINVLLGGK